MDILLKPDELCLSGSMNHFVISTRNEITFVLGDAGTGTAIVRHTYTPNKSNRIEVDLENIVSPLLSFELKDTSDAYRQSSIVRRFKVDIAEVGASGTFSWTFSVLRAGIDHFADSAVNFLKANFLTWQPTVKPVTYYTPEFLTYYAVVDSVVRCKAYVDANGKYDETTLTMANLSNGSVWTVPVQYAIIAGKLGKLPSYYDIWVEDASGTRLTYIQRYYASDIRSEEEQWVLFENSLGGIDTFRAYGDSENTAKHTHSVVEIENESEEYRVDTEREFKKNTGFLSRDERKWLLDFFPSLGKYLYVDGGIRRIVVTDSDVTWKAKELPSSYTFTYKYADARPYLNLSRTDMPAEVLDIKIPDVASFTVAPRLAELDRLQLSGGALFPVQNPYSDKWNVTTAAAILEYLAREITAAYKGDGAFGHTHDNMSVLAALDRFGQYLTLDAKKVSAGYADEANDISAGSGLWDKLLRKDIPDSTRFLLTLLGGIAFNGKYGVSGLGKAILKSLQLDNASIDEEGRAIMEALTSPDFKESGTLLDGKGFGLYTDVHGRSHAVADIIEARVKAVFAELEVKKFTFSSGDQGFTRAGSEIARVRVLDNGDFRCYWLADDGERRISNDFHVGDQAMAKTSNIISKTTQMAENRYYWRLVVNTGEETLEDGKLYNFVDLSDTRGTVTLTVGGKDHTCIGCDTSVPNDEPKAEDSIVQLGSQTDPERRYAYIIYVSTGERVTYAGINDYDLDSHIVELRSAKRNFTVSGYHEIISASGTGEGSPLVCERGAWYNGAVSGHYDHWSHNNATWLCIVGKGRTTTEPKDGSPEWVKETYGLKGDKGDPGKDGTSVKITSTEIRYAVTKDNRQPADSAFTNTTIPALAQKDYLWTRTVVNYSDNNSTKSYSVSRIGGDGPQGIPGANGKTTHFAYAKSADGKDGFSTTFFNGATYIGTYDDTNTEDSTDYKSYTWSPLKGDAGTSSHTFLRYSDDGGKTFTPAKPWVETGEYGNGRNLLNGVPQEVSFSTQKDFTVGPIGKVLVGSRYAVSFDVENSEAQNAVGDVLFWSQTWKNVVIVHFVADNTKKHVEFSFVMPNWIENGSNSGFRARFRKTSGSGTVTVSKAKLEIGDTATGWTPSPEDQQLGTTPGKNLGTLVWDKPYPSMDTSAYTWSEVQGRDAVIRHSPNGLWFSNADTGRIEGYNGKWLVITYPYHTGDPVCKELLEGSGTAADGCFQVTDEVMNTTRFAPDGNNREWFSYYAVTYAYFTEATTVNYTARTDDRSALYVNDRLLYNIETCTDTPVSINFDKGWNKVEFILEEGVSEQYTHLDPWLSRSTNCLGIDCSQAGTIPADYLGTLNGDGVLDFMKYSWAKVRGEDGRPGSDAVSVSLSAELITVDSDDNGAVPPEALNNAYADVKAYRGNKRTAVTANVIGTSAPGIGAKAEADRIKITSIGVDPATGYAYGSGYVDIEAVVAGTKYPLRLFVGTNLHKITSKWVQDTKNFKSELGELKKDNNYKMTLLFAIIQQNKESIEQKVGKTEFDANNTKVSERIAKVETTAEGLTSRARKVSGGNVLKGIVSGEGWNTNMKVSGTSTAVLLRINDPIISPAFANVPGIYTVSFGKWLGESITPADITVRVYQYTTDFKENSDALYPIEDKYKIDEFTVAQMKLSELGRYWHTFRETTGDARTFRLAFLSRKKDAYLYQLQVESGDIATAFNEGQVISETLFKQTSDSIEAHAKDVDLKMKNGEFTVDAQKTTFKGPNGKVSGMFENGKFKADLIDAMKVIAAAMKAGEIDAEFAKFKNMIVEGAVSSPYMTVGSGFDLTGHDNAWLGGNNEWVNYFNLRWDVSQRGRTLHLSNYGTSLPTTGVGKINAPSGKWFFDNGRKFSQLLVYPGTVVVLHGLGDENTFHGWLVEQRHDPSHNKTGVPFRAFAWGFATCSKTGDADFENYRTFDGSRLGISRMGAGWCRITMPYAWYSILQTYGSHWYRHFGVIATGYGYSEDGANEFCPIKASVKSMGLNGNTPYVDIWLSDDDTANDGRFQFIFYNMDWNDGFQTSDNR